MPLVFLSMFQHHVAGSEYSMPPTVLELSPLPRQLEPSSRLTILAISTQASRIFLSRAKKKISLTEYARPLEDYIWLSHLNFCFNSVLKAPHIRGLASRSPFTLALCLIEPIQIQTVFFSLIPGQIELPDDPVHAGIGTPRLLPPSWIRMRGTTLRYSEERYTSVPQNMYCTSSAKENVIMEVPQKIYFLGDFIIM